LEFSEDDLPALQIQALSSQLRDVIAEVARLAATYEVGHLLRDGVKIAIVGPPNAGKSSLFNSLLGLPRAIVTDIPGTTRDTINEQLSWDGFPVLLTDTAGIRQSQDPLEEIGIERTRTTMAEADLCLVVIDGSTSLEKNDLDNLLLDEKAKQILVLNKLDLPSFKDRVIELGQKVRQVKVSAVTGEGLDELRTAILENFGGIDSEDAGLLVTNARHNDLLRRTETHLREAETLLDEKASEELVLIGLHNALRFLDDITGETTAEDILSEIFSTFCIGK
jgi:tRNA modification GTPase